MLAVLTGGCVSTETAHREEVPVEAGGDPLVVALIDSGINPYHTAFRVRDAETPDSASIVETVARSGTEVARVDLSLGANFDRDFESDAAFWNSTQPGMLYAFAGTRAMGISFSDPGFSQYVVEDSPPAHGTGTAGLVAREAPGAIVVSVQTHPGLCATYDDFSCVDDPSTANAMEWIAAQPWIDVVSASLGARMNAMPPPSASPELRRFLEASRAASDSGKLLVFATGNDAAPALANQYNGPPWVISAGGAEVANRGESVAAGKTPDVVANFTELRALGGTFDGYEVGSGTSYATPIVAGTLAHALGLIRDALGPEGGLTSDGALAAGRTADGRALRVTHRELRAALNASATYFGPTEWDPTAPNGQNTVGMAFSRSIPVVAPAQQMGWGYVHAGFASEIARRVLEEDYELPPEKLASEPWMRAQYEARAAYWENAP